MDKPSMQFSPFRMLWAYFILLALLLGGYTFSFTQSTINHFLYQEIEDDTKRLATYLGADFRMGPIQDQSIDYRHVQSVDKLRDDMGIFKLKLYDSVGRVIFSSDPADIGTINNETDFRQQVMQGKMISNLEQEVFTRPQGEPITHEVMESYYPYMDGGRFLGAFEIYFDVTNKVKELTAVTYRIYLSFFIGTGLMLVLAIGLMRHYSRIDLIKEKKHSNDLLKEIEKRNLIEEELSIKERNLDFIAHHDDLKGQPNRRLYQEQLELTLINARRYHRSFCLIFLDLDNFKDVNDTLGHSAGDQLLKAVVIRLQNVLRESDFLARIGGDEFTLILKEIDNPESAALAAGRILKALHDPVLINDVRIKANASLGICLFPQDGNSAEELTKHADAAMYEAKRQSKGSSQFYNQEVSTQSTRQLKIQSDLDSGAFQNQLVLHYQPQIELSTGHVLGAEALVRWQHPELGLIPPDEFIPIAERSDSIIGLGEWVMETAAKQVRQWQQKTNVFLPVAVNLSPRQFRDPHLLERICKLIPSAKNAPIPIELELTETLLMKDTELAVATLQACTDLKLKISIDDFGTGYSSLSYLQKFPAQKLKIDRSFISQINDPYTAVIVETIIGLGKNLGMTLIAEGAEEEYQIDFLTQRGCDLVQGYYFSKPLPATEFEHQWLTAEHRHPLKDPLSPSTSATVIPIRKEI